MCDRCSKSDSDGIRTISGEQFKRLYRKRIALRKRKALIRKNKYDALANELADLLITNWDAQTKAAISDFVGAVRGSGKVTSQELDALLEIVQLRLGVEFASLTIEAIASMNATVYELGVSEVGAAMSATFRIIDIDALNWLDNHQLYWVRNYYDRQLAGIVSDLAKEVIKQGLTRDQAATLFTTTLETKFPTTTYRYWDGFANHVVTRAREFGRVDAYVRAGAENLRVVAVLDHRTSGICRYMHNRIIPVSDAVELKEKMMEADNPEDVKKIAPFLKEKEVKGQATKNLKRVSAGYALPPYHFDCRSRTVVYREAKEKIKVMGSSAPKDSEAYNLTHGLTREETELWISEMKQKGGRLRFNKKDFKSDSKKHAPKFDFPEPDYLNEARKTIKRAKKISISNYKDALMFNFYGDKGYVVVNAVMEIKGFYHQGDSEMAFNRKGKLKSSWYILDDE